MAATERVTISDLLKAVVHDPWRKLVSLLLAVLLWHYLDAQVSSSETVQLGIGFMHETDEADLRDGPKLFVQCDLRTYGVIGIENATTGEEVALVDVLVAGAKRLVEIIDENPGFVARIDPTTENGEIFAVFGEPDIRPIDARFEDLTIDLAPPRIRVRLELNAETSIALDRRRISFAQAPNAASILDRILWEDATFDPAVVQLRGPASIVNEWAAPGMTLFEIGTEFPPPGASQLRLVLSPLAELPDKLWISNSSVMLTVPLQTDARTFRLQDVPMVLVEPEQFRGRFKLSGETVDVEIAATGSLKARLSLMSPDQLRAWAKNNATLLAAVPIDAGGPDSITNPHLWIKEYAERTDFRVTVPPIVHFELKTP